MGERAMRQFGTYGTRSPAATQSLGHRKSIAVPEKAEAGVTADPFSVLASGAQAGDVPDLSDRNTQTGSGGRR